MRNARNDFAAHFIGPTLANDDKIRGSYWMSLQVTLLKGCAKGLAVMSTKKGNEYYSLPSSFVSFLTPFASVLVHCSDGWDRTSQIAAGMQVLLDPHYRTMQGLALIIDKEFVKAGHKFNDRNGVGHFTDPNEQCPVLLQFLGITRYLNYVF